MNSFMLATQFLGWCSAINLGLLLFSSVMLMLFNRQITTIHGALFNVSEDALNRLYLAWLGHYKIAIIVLNVVPYVALKLMSDGI